MPSILKLFANPTLPAILSLFLLNPDEELYQSDIAKRIDKALMQVQRALKTLEEIGLVTITRRGKMVYYKARRDHPAFADLRHLFLKTIVFENTILKTLHPYRDKIDFAFIFGSYATGEESSSSDIDLFLVCNISLRELSKVLSPLSEKLQRELNPVIIGQKEFKKRILGKDHFVLKVISSPKIWIIGNESNFERLVKRGKA